MDGEAFGLLTEQAVIAEPLSHGYRPLDHGVSRRVEPRQAEGDAAPTEQAATLHAVAPAHYRQSPLAQLQHLGITLAPGEVMAHDIIGTHCRFAVPQPFVSGRCLAPIRKSFVPAVEGAPGQPALVEEIGPRREVSRWLQGEGDVIVA